MRALARDWLRRHITDVCPTGCRSARVRHASSVPVYLYGSAVQGGLGRCSVCRSISSERVIDRMSASSSLLFLPLSAPWRGTPVTHARDVEKTKRRRRDLSSIRLDATSWKGSGKGRGEGGLALGGSRRSTLPFPLPTQESINQDGTGARSSCPSLHRPFGSGVMG